MSNRRIVTQQFQAKGAGVELDTYFDRLIKYVPAEIIGAWVAVTGLIATEEETNAALGWIVFGIGVIMTAAWIWKRTQVKDLPPAVAQIVISTLAFCVWVFALGGIPFKNLAFYKPLYGSLILILFSLVSALITPKK